MTHSTRPSILLVEDDRTQAALIERWLKPRYDVLHCEDGDVGVETAQRGSFDLVLSDIRLPGCSGIELTAAVGKRSDAPPVLLMTSETDVQLAVDAIEHGVSGYLLKPLDQAHLEATLARALASRGARGRTILAIGAHPDDVEIGVGGTLLAHRREGDRVVVLTLSGGASGGDESVRRGESQAAADRLGAELRMANLPDTRMEVGPTTIDAISRVIREVAPDVVYTHTANDNHQDHRAVHHATLVAARGVSNVYCYQSPSSTVAFQPSTFVDIREHLGSKLELLHAYATQTSTRAYLSDDHIRATAGYWGRFAGYGLVEPLEVVRASRSS